MANVNKLTGDLQGIVGDLKKGKGTLGKMLVEDEIADQVKQTLSSVQKIVGKADSLRTELSVFSGMNTVSGSDTEVGFRLVPMPERFYHLGLTTSEFGPDQEKITETTTNGTTTIESKKEKQKNTFRFNAQIGRRIQDLAFRGGLIESSGGLGVDYYLPLLSSKVSLEAFDYKKNKGANVRVSTEAQVYNVIYGKASLNDSFRKDRSATFSAGLRFNDEDLKGLLGFFF
jgi:phospholipid/cholesterol/gamma-HCH transport system substrate-binding protein